MFARFVNSSSKISKVLSNVRTLAEYTGPRERSMNMVQLLGRVGADPVMRGDANRFVTFDMATSSQYPKKMDDGEIEYITKTEWHSISVFRSNLVGKVEKFVQKGTRLLVNGSLEYRSVEREDGTVVEYSRVVPDDVIILASSKEYSGY